MKRTKFWGCLLLALGLMIPTTIMASTILPVFGGGTGVGSFGQGWLYSTGGTTTLAASTSPTVNYITATSTTATSSLANALIVGANSKIPYMRVGSTTPNYGYFNNDLVDVYDQRNDELAVNIGNGATAPCGSSDFVMNGDISGAATDFLQVGFANSGWTGSGCSLNSKTGVSPEDGFLYNPTGNIDVLAGSSTASVGIRFFTGGSASTNQRMSINAKGQIGIASSTPSLNFGVSIATTTAIQNAQIATSIASSTTDNSTETVNWNNGNIVRYILKQNTSFVINATSSNPLDGGKYILKLCQDPVGSRTVTFITPGQLRFANGTTSISSAANTCSLIGMIYDANESLYDVVASSTGLLIN